MRLKSILVCCQIAIIIIATFSSDNIHASDKCTINYQKVKNYYNGSKGYHKDRNKAFELLKKGAESNCSQMMIILATMYENGDEIEPDKNEALRLYESAAEMGNLEAQEIMGHIYARGELVEQDTKKAIMWYKRAAEEGHGESQLALACMYLYAPIKPNDTEKEKGLQWLRKAVVNNVPEALYRFGQIDGKDNARTRIYWLIRASEKGYPPARMDLATALTEGIGISRDPEKAKYCFKKAAQRIDPEKIYDAGVNYYGGIGVNRDYDMALFLFRLAASKGVAAANYSLGDMYDQGKGVKKNMGSATVAYKSAAAQGHDFSMIKLGSIYKRSGQMRNLIESYQWYRLAEMCGNELAKDELTELEKEMTSDQIAMAEKRAQMWVMMQKAMKTPAARILN